MPPKKRIGRSSSRSSSRKSSRKSPTQKRSTNRKSRSYHSGTKTKAPRFRKVKSNRRLSARHYYDNTGNLNDSCMVSGELKKLLLRANGSPYWQKCTANVQAKHGRCILNCKDPAGL